jgi:PPOX class probable F420-dependent enzyme
MRPEDLDAAALAFLSEYHLATLTTLRADGSPHVVPVGFSYDPDERLVRIITFASSVKAANARRGGRAAVSQVDGGRWLTLEGPVSSPATPPATASRASDPTGSRSRSRSTACSAAPERARRRPAPAGPAVARPNVCDTRPPRAPPTHERGRTDRPTIPPCPRSST